MHHDLAGLLGKLLSYGVNHVYQASVGQILDIVHHCSTAGLYGFGQFTDVGCLGTVNGEQIEEFLDFCEVFQLYLFDEQNVHFGHHIHRFQEIFREVAMFKKERVETVVDVIMEIPHRTHLGQDLFDDMFMVFQYVFKFVGREVVACLQIQIFSE